MSLITSFAEKVPIIWLAKAPDRPLRTPLPLPVYPPPPCESAGLLLYERTGRLDWGTDRDFGEVIRPHQISTGSHEKTVRRQNVEGRQTTGIHAAKPLHGEFAPSLIIQVAG